MDKQQLLTCHQQIAPYVHNTPVLTSTMINKLTHAKVFFKCENFQRMGAYKMRGATHAILQLSEGQKARGVVTHSSGNFAQALSLAAKILGVKAYIVMPSSAPIAKKEAVLGYGGIIEECESTLIARQQAAEKIVKATGATFIHPSNDLHVIMGQGTACMELLKEQPDLDAVFVPVGGGGLIAGTSLAAYAFGNNCRVFGGEPMEADDAYRSLKSGKIEDNQSANTIADGLRTHLGDINFPIIQKYAAGIIRVEEEEIISAMRFIWQRMKLVVEPSSAVALAALIKEKVNFENNKIGVIISGGNVDLKNLPF